MPAVEAAEFMAAVASARGPAGVETPAETGGTPEPDPQPVNVDLLALMREGVTSREPVGVPEAMHCDCGRALPCRHCPDVPAIWWSSEYQRFYMIGEGPMAQRLTSGPSLVHEPETRFMPSDIVPLVPAGSVSTTPDPAAVSVATDDFIDALYDQLPAVVTFPRDALEKAVAAALGGTATPQPSDTETAGNDHD
jgi:hypothetical protein